MRRRYNNFNYKTTTIKVWHPNEEQLQDDELDFAMVEIYFKWHYYHGETPSFDNPNGTPAEYDFELIKFSKSAEWVTEELVQSTMNSMCASELYEEDFIEY